MICSSLGQWSMQIHLLWSLHFARRDPFAKDAAQTDSANGTSFRKEVREAERTHREATAEGEGLGERWWKVSRDGREFVQISIWYIFIHFCSHCCTICWVSWHFLWQCCSQDGVARQPGGIDRSLALQCCWIEIVGRILFKQWVNCMWIIITPNQIRNAYDDVWRCIVLVEVSWRPVLLPLLFFSQIALLTIACRM